ncbi:hypothetical protein K7X08_012569 [Anisodus acutangulus]|uniref:Uncharacterized protein n=1 Tax=Anisodus acutangulus TaxID=402998 RepID=A0A9Q1LDE0_9SOLA|nr:hypothetical protein K7X08_012569 [Anisodus acutangulus]
MPPESSKKIYWSSMLPLGKMCTPGMSPRSGLRILCLELKLVVSLQRHIKGISQKAAINLILLPKRKEEYKVSALLINQITKEALDETIRDWEIPRKTTHLRHLREEMAGILSRGHLREYLSERAQNNYERGLSVEGKSNLATPPHVINMIYGG